MTTSLLQDEYNKLDGSNLTPAGKMNIINNIVQIKTAEPNLKSFKRDFSIDVKEYIRSIIGQAEYGRIKYDKISPSNIEQLLASLTYNERIYSINYLIRQLHKSSFEDEIKIFQKLRTKTILQKNISNLKSIRSWWSLLINFPLYNIWSLLTTLFLIAIITCLILLPAPFKIMAWLNFKIEYVPTSNTFALKHFLNIIGNLVGINDCLKIVPQNCFSLIIFILAKVFAFTYVITLIFNKLSEYLKK